ncbi:MAG: glycosyltransferase, partial [Candidatus Eisenbacteria bacterium]
AGFAVETLITAISWWPVDSKVMDLLGKLGLDTTLRGDNTLCLGRRAGPPQARWPAEFYHGGEVGRDAQDRPAEDGAGGSQAALADPAEALTRTPSAHVCEAVPSPAGRCCLEGSNGPATASPGDMTRPAPRKQDDPRGSPRGADSRVRPLRVLIANNIVPNHDRGGSCYRMMTLLRLMVEDGHQITYLGRDAKGMDKYVRDLEALGIRVHGTDPEKLRVWDDVQTEPLDLARIMKTGDFDVAVLVLWFWSSPSVPEQYLHEIRLHSPKTRIVVLSDDVHWLHDTRMGAVTGARSDLERGLGYRPRELEIFRRADLVAAITEDDAARIRAEDAELETVVLPHYVIPREGTPPGFEPRRDLVTVGAFGYHANVDAAVWFAREVFPLVRASLPGVRFRIVGANPPASVRDLACEEIEVKGWVPDIIEELDRCRVFVSAIRYGTGLKTKNIQAMGAGIPLVGTSLSLEGSGARRGVEAAIEDDPRAFADAVIRLYTDEAAWSRQARAARALALSEFGKEAVRGAIRRCLARAASIPARTERDGQDWSITRIERRDPAITTAAQASQRFRARLAAHLSLANERMKAGRPGDALAELRNVLAHCGQGAFAQNPQFFSGIMCRFGDAHLALGQPEDAAACFREALALDPEEDDAIHALREIQASGADPLARSTRTAGHDEPLPNVAMTDTRGRIEGEPVMRAASRASQSCARPLPECRAMLRHLSSDRFPRLCPSKSKVLHRPAGSSPQPPPRGRHRCGRAPSRSRAAGSSRSSAPPSTATCGWVRSAPTSSGSRRKTRSRSCSWDRRTASSHASCRGYASAPWTRIRSRTS